ncbi:MAG: aldo/keto reductase [Candidatus Saccharimonadales bacterium]
MSVPKLKLADGHRIPQVGLGTWKLPEEAYMKAFNAAVQAGYRHFDTAQAYGNEELLGEAWHKAGLKREELFITTKINVTNFGYGRAKSAFDRSLKNIRTDYVDLLLLHFPVPLLRKKSWQALEEIQADGKARSIGVSNYTIHHLEEMQDYAKVSPVVNQIELHVFLQQPELVKYCQDHDITLEAYSPLAHGTPMDDTTILRLARKHDRTYAQIMLRWCLQKGFVVIPKSATPSRIMENIELFDFELDDKDMAELAAQDKDLRTCWNPTHVP